MAASSSELWLIAGPNGAGKTTFTQRKPLNDLLANVRLLNADDLTLQLLRSQGYCSFDEPSDLVLKETFIAAAEQTMTELLSALSTHEPIATETVLSTSKFKPVVETVVQSQGFFGLIYVALESPELACVRVRKRHTSGGHTVPDEKVRSR